MLDADRKQYIKNTIRSLTEMLGEHDDVVRKLAEMRAGYPTGHAGSGSGSAEPVRDFALDTKKKLDGLVLELHRKADGLDGIRLGVLRAALKPGEVDPGCEIIARYAKESFEPVHREGDVGGRLPRKARLGLWAYEFVTRYGDPDNPSEDYLPTRAETEQHVKGIRVRRKETRKAS